MSCDSTSADTTKCEFVMWKHEAGKSGKAKVCWNSAFFLRCQNTVPMKTALNESGVGGRVGGEGGGGGEVGSQ